jgi:hypothetical protein
LAEAKKEHAGRIRAVGSSRLLEEASQEIAARDDLNWVAALCRLA